MLIAFTHPCVHPCHAGAFLLSYKPSLYQFNQIVELFSDGDFVYYVGEKGYSDQEVFNVLYGADHYTHGNKGHMGRIRYDAVVQSINNETATAYGRDARFAID